MNSIMTNTSAMTALQSLNKTNQSLVETQARVSTGYKVATATDNAAYWSIATTMRSDLSALSTVQDALGLGAATVDVAYTALESTIDVVSEIKAKLVAAREPGVDRAKIQSEISELQNQLVSITDSAVFSGENWLSVNSADASYNSTKTIVASFSRTSAPDQALIRFDEFLRGLPSGVQLFAMLLARPLLLDLIAEIMGGAPMLAERLGRNPGLLDAVLTPGFFAGVPSREKLAEEFAELAEEAASFENLLDDSRRWANDHKFQAGVQILRQSVDVDESGRALSDIAGTVLRGLYGPVLDLFAERHGHIPGARAAIIAFGKLGAREMTVASDLDLVFLYDFDDTAEASDGPKPLQPVLYFARLAQRYITALSAQTAEGELYEIDMRLRPSGKSGPLATSLTSLLSYYRGDAWTWEHMALTRARPVAGDPDFMAAAADAIRDILTMPRDPDQLLIDVAAMRRRIEKEKPAKSLWSVKYLRGGLIDLEFIAQYLQLRHAHEKPEVLDPSTQAAFARLAGAGCLDARSADFLIEATRLFRRVQGVLRLTVGPAFDADTLPAGLQAVLAREAEMPDFASLRAYLVETAQASTEIYRSIVEEPAERLQAATKP